jgi:hypothetical protein
VGNPFVFIQRPYPFTLRRTSRDELGGGPDLEPSAGGCVPSWPAPRGPVTTSVLVDLNKPRAA